MAQNTKPAAQKPVDPAVPTNPKKKIFLILGVLLLVIIAGGGGWYFAKPKHDAAHVEEVKVAPPKTPIFILLEPFTVNLQRESSDQYLQLGITLKVFDSEIETKIKERLPEIRSRILQLLTTKTATELLTAEGKKQLVTEILSMSNTIIGVVNAPAKAAAPERPAIISAASQVSETAVTTQAAPAAAVTNTSAASANQPEVKMPVEKTGIVDVLFNSFIIQ